MSRKYDTPHKPRTMRLPAEQFNIVSIAAAYNKKNEVEPMTATHYYEKAMDEYIKNHPEEFEKH